MGRKFFLKENTHLGGVIILLLQLVVIDKYFMRASPYLLPTCFMSSFSVVDAKGWRSLGTKAMKFVSNTKHHQFKILFLQVVLVFGLKEELSELWS
jgi:hypothetical protein